MEANQCSACARSAWIGLALLATLALSVARADPAGPGLAATPPVPESPTAAPAAAPAPAPVGLTMFSPQGEVKGVRQVVARFAAPVVAFGDARGGAPFDIDCPAKGHGRWTDSNVWVYDFDQDLPAGVRCAFEVKAGFSTPDGIPLQAGRHEFNTGGPAILETYPTQGNAQIDEHQVFLALLDGPVDPATVRERAYCDITGISERVPVQVLEGKERQDLIEQVAPRAHYLLTALTKRGQIGVLGVKDQRFSRAPLLVLRCARTLPAGRQVKLVWPQGISTPATAAVPAISTTTKQALPYEVREDFKASTSCERVNAKAGCVPVLPIALNLTAPITLPMAMRLELRMEDGRVIHPDRPRADRGETLGKDATVQSLSFPGPFPARSDVVISLPKDFADDAGRPLANRSLFPLKIAIDDDPPLVKVSSSFGILESEADPALPVSVRNVEQTLAAWHLEPKSPLPGFFTGASLRINADDDRVIAAWMRRLLEGPTRMTRSAQKRGYLRPGEAPLLTADEFAGAAKMQLPVPDKGRTLQLVGVPLPDKGLHVVQFASDRLGAVLHGEKLPYYVYAGALVTNMSVHFKQGRESSLAWVTALDTAAPVGDARVQVSDCQGKPLWSGTTDASGIARIPQQLPSQWNYEACPHAPSALLVTARKDGDMSLLLTSWNEGISTWQFNLAGGDDSGPIVAHTITDRPLFRAGETVSMKHLIRRRTGQGFGGIDADHVPHRVIITHLGTDQTYVQDLVWKGGSALSTWTIPKEAHNGQYSITLAGANQGAPVTSGEFRVEQFRVPLMRAVLQPPAQALVRSDRARVTAQLSYLSGGPAAGAAVKFRSRVVPREVHFDAYDEFSFGGEAPALGITTAAPAWMNDVESDADEGGEGAVEGASGEPGDAQAGAAKGAAVATRNVTLDANGGASVDFDGLPVAGVAGHGTAPQTLEVEMGYSDPNGQILSAATQVPLFSSHLLLGMKLQGFGASKERLSYMVLALDTEGRPQAQRRIDVQAYQRSRFSYRKRLIGGFYAYEQNTEVRKLGPACQGSTNAQGLLVCDRPAPGTGEIILVAQAEDEQGNSATANVETYVAGNDDYWFEAGASDRIDLLPDHRSYEPGETARFEVRMPFRQAQALVTVEREGVIDAWVTPVSAKSPYVSVPILPSYGPNIYVSALVVRGRVGGQKSATQQALGRIADMVGVKVAGKDDEPEETAPPPGALVDLGKPAFRLGLAQVQVGWKGYELKVGVTPEKPVYRVREKVPVTIAVTDADGRPVANADLAVAAVDEGLLALRANTSWDLLRRMMQRRAEEVQTSTAQGQVVGKRHFGKKAAAPGGGGGASSARELFDTLLLWVGSVRTDAQGRAQVVVPLNDSLTSFRIEAVAVSGVGRFGSGGAAVRTTQDLMLYSGLSPFVREGDRFRALFTLRNTVQRHQRIEVSPQVLARDGAGRSVDIPALAPQQVDLGPGEARTLEFEAQAPVDSEQLDWKVDARELGVATAGTASGDRLVVHQRVGVAFPVRVYQQTLLQLQPGQAQAFDVAAPEGAIAGRGGVRLRLASSLGGDESSIRDWAERYPYTCLEQRASVAVIAADLARWRATMQALPGYLDADGLARYFPMEMLPGDDALTAYLLDISDQSGFPIPESARTRMFQGLQSFVSGRIHRWGSLPTADLAIRKLAAIEALSRYGQAQPAMLDSIAVEPNLWPSSAVIDWVSLLTRMQEIPDRDARLEQARQILRSRLSDSGTTMLFSTEKSDYLWWLMVSGDRNAARTLLLAVDDPTFATDVGRLARGALGRQLHGRWNTTVANAWGVLALRHFREKFEKDPVTGVTNASLGDTGFALDWAAKAAPAANPADATRAGTDPTLGTPVVAGPERDLPWPAVASRLTLEHRGGGAPWAFVASRAALPLREPLFAGYTVHRSVTPVEQATPGQWRRGDVLRVRLDIEAQQDMTWVAVADPIPAGATVLGSGLGGDSAQLTAGEAARGWTGPSFEERTFEGYRAYYQYLPKGKFAVEYTVRLNNAGSFVLPATRVEAMYAPEVFGEAPVAPMEIRP